MKNDLNHFSQL